MKTLYHNYFISNFFEPSRLVWDTGKPKSKPKQKAIATSLGSEPEVPGMTAADAAKKAAKESGKATFRSLKGRVEAIANYVDKNLLDTLVKDLKSNEDKAADKKNYEMAYNYGELIKTAKKNWKNKEKTKETETAGKKEVKTLEERKVRIRQKMYARLSKIRNRKKLQEEVNNLIAEYNKKISESDNTIDKKVYKGMIKEANGYLLDRAKEGIAIPEKTVAALKGKMQDKIKVTKFLTEIAALKPRDWGGKRAKFKTIFASDIKLGAYQIARAMQKALKFKGGDIDAAIGPITVARLEEHAKIAKKPGKKPGQQSGATVETAKTQNPVTNKTIAGIDKDVDKEQRRKDFKIFKKFVREQEENPYRENGQILFEIAYKGVGGPKKGKEQEWVENMYIKVDNLRRGSEKIDFDNLRRKPEKTEKRRDDYAYNTGTYKQLSNHVKAINPKIKKIMGDVDKFPEFDNINANELTKYEKMAYKVKMEIKNPSTKKGRLAKLATNVNWNKAVASNKRDYLGYNESKMENAIIDEYAKQNNRNVAGVRKSLRA